MQGPESEWSEWVQCGAKDKELVYTFNMWKPWARFSDFVYSLHSKHDGVGHIWYPNSRYSSNPSKFGFPSFAKITKYLVQKKTHPIFPYFLGGLRHVETHFFLPCHGHNGMIQKAQKAGAWTPTAQSGWALNRTRDSGPSSTPDLGHGMIFPWNGGIMMGLWMGLWYLGIILWLFHIYHNPIYIMIMIYYDGIMIIYLIPIYSNNPKIWSGAGRWFRWTTMERLGLVTDLA